MNLEFIKAMYTEMNILNHEKNIFVVVMTQDKQVANALCRLNGLERVQPLPGYFDESISIRGFAMTSAILVLAVATNVTSAVLVSM